MAKMPQLLELENITATKNIAFTITKVNDHTWNLKMFHNDNLVWDNIYTTFRNACKDGITVLTTQAPIWGLDNLN